MYKLGFLFILLGCTNSDRSSVELPLAVDQGPCGDLGVDACKLDERCQQSLVESQLGPEPQPYRCLLLTSETSNAPCSELSLDACRGRNDCSPVLVQELGPADDRIGDPSFASCETEN